MGFRFTARSLAADLGIVGWVRNLNDGRVEITAEAEEETLENFLTGVADSFKSYIAETDLSWIEASGEFKDFDIKI